MRTNTSTATFSSIEENNGNIKDLASHDLHGMRLIFAHNGWLHAGLANRSGFPLMKWQCVVLIDVLVSIPVVVSSALCTSS